MFGSLKCVFTKCTFLGPQLSRRGLVWYLPNSSKAPDPRVRPASTRASRGLDNEYKLLLYIGYKLSSLVLYLNNAIKVRILVTVVNINV